MTNAYTPDHVLTGYEATLAFTKELTTPVGMRIVGSIKTNEQLNEKLLDPTTQYEIWDLSEEDDDSENIINKFHSFYVKPLRNLMMQGYEEGTEEYNNAKLDDSEVYLVYVPGDTVLALHYRNFDYEVDPTKLTCYYTVINKDAVILQDNGLRFSDKHIANLLEKHEEHSHLLDTVKCMQTHYRMILKDKEVSPVIFEADSFINFPVPENVVVKEMNTGNLYLIDINRLTKEETRIGRDAKPGDGVLLVKLEISDVSARNVYYPLGWTDDDQLKVISNAGRVHVFSGEALDNLIWVPYNEVTSDDNE